MDVLLFFLFGCLLALIADRLILRFQCGDEDEDGDDGADGDEPSSSPPRLERKQLPWQTAPWDMYLRRAVVLFLPPLTALAGSRFDRTLDAIAVSLLVTGLLICTATDLLRYRVPNAVTYPGTLFALVAAFLLAPDATELASAAVAAFLAGLIFLVMAILTRGGLGLGDVKLAVLIGAALGLQTTYQALALGVLAGGVTIGLLFLLRVVGRKQALPYAPFLALSAVGFLLVQGPVFAPL